MNNSLKVGVLFLGRRRPGFDMDWGKQMEERVRKQLKQTHFSIFESEKAVDDASLRKAMAALPPRSPNSGPIPSSFGPRRKISRAT